MKNTFWPSLETHLNKNICFMWSLIYNCLHGKWHYWKDSNFWTQNNILFPWSSQNLLMINEIGNYFFYYIINRTSYPSIVFVIKLKKLVQLTEQQTVQTLIWLFALALKYPNDLYVIMMCFRYIVKNKKRSPSHHPNLSLKHFSYVNSAIQWIYSFQNN